MMFTEGFISHLLTNYLVNNIQVVFLLTVVETNFSL